MQNKLRFGELHNVCFNKENYTHPLQKELEPFTNVGRTETINEVVTRENMEFLLLDSVANNDKERIEKQVGIIIKGERDNTNDKAVLQLHRQILTYGTPLWAYLHKIEDDSITVYHLVQKMGEDEYWQKKRINLIFSENEICYCIMKILCNYLRDNERFNIEYNRYLNLFEGTEKEFINFLVDTKFNTYIDGHINIKDLPYYEKLRDKLYDIKNNLSTPDHVEVGKAVQQPPIIKDEVNGIPCTEFDNLFGADIARKNEVWQYMKLLGMIDNEGNYLLKKEKAIIRAFVMVMKKNGRFSPTADEGFLIRVLGLKLLANNKVRVRESKKIKDKQNEIVTFLNNQETKNNSFVNVD